MLRKRLPPKPDRSAEFASWVSRPRAVARSTGEARMAVPCPKAPPRIESEPYRRLVASLPCIRCRAVGASQAAHPNAGKAKSAKADDTLCFPLCTITALDCHGKWDTYRCGGRQSQAVREPIYANATQLALIAAAEHDKKIRRILESVGLLPATKA